MHRKALPLIALAAATTLTSAAMVDIFPLSSTFDDYLAPHSIEIAGLTLESHRLGSDENNTNKLQEWNDYAFIINEYDKNGDILRQSLCEESEVAALTGDDDETICYYALVVEETMDSLTAEDIEDIQENYAGIIEDFASMEPYGGGDYEDRDWDDDDDDDDEGSTTDGEEDVNQLRQTVSLRFGPATGKLDFGVTILGEDGTRSRVISVEKDDWTCTEPTPADPSQTQYCIWTPSSKEDRMIVLPTSRRRRS